jgi:hypothetical protein
MSQTEVQNATTELTYPRHPRTLQQDWDALKDHNEAIQKATEKKPAEAREAKAPREEEEPPKSIKESWERFVKQQVKTDETKPAKETAEAKPESEEKSDTKTKPDAKSSEETQDEHEPAPDDRLWRGAQLEEKEVKVIQQRAKRMDQGVKDHIDKHENRAQIEGGLRNLFLGRPDQQNDFFLALTEIKNPAEVVAHLGLNKAARETLLQQPNWRLLRSSVHLLSQALPKAAKPEPPADPKPRAPKPPVEVGGRGTVSDHEGYAVRNNDFASAEAIWNARKGFKSAR